MRKIFFALTFLPVLILFSCNEETNQEQIAEHEIGQCIYSKSTRKINDIFPFNACDRIELVTYDSIGKENEFRQIHRARTILTDSLGQYGFCERVRIDSILTDSLFSIFYNYKSIDSMHIRAACYNPRHAILFYKGQTLIEYFEICFECAGTEYLRKESSFPGFCNEQWSYLKQFFRNAGIKTRLDRQH